MSTEQAGRAFDEATDFDIDDADIERDRAAAGSVAAVRDLAHVGTATPEAIRNFAFGYGDDNPLYVDPDHGATTRWGGQVAPQIMAAVLNTPLRGDRLPKELRGGSYRGIHAFVSGGTWEWYRPIHAGDRLYSFKGLESVEVKKSEFAGRSVIRVNREVKFNQRGEVVGVYRTLIILTARKKARETGKYKDVPEPAYTPEDIAELDKVFAAETVRGTETRWFEDVTVGESLGTLAKGPLTTTDMVVFHAGGYGFVPYGLRTSRLNWRNRQRIPAFYVDNEYGVPDVAQRVHWDSEWAKAIGNPRAYDYGVLRECWLHHRLTDWMGDEGFVVRQHDEIRKFNYQGDIQYVTGEVTAKRREHDMNLVDVELRAVNQRGEETTRGEATIALRSRDHGRSLLPTPPTEVQQKVWDIMDRHAQLGSEHR
ncbi:FAS1-like dehydratase domain-containing protein [Actinophytocola gossypii]|uniref:MaoC family dehydratase N-terminal domain-containing protein n=1 Tax=Actinophytocola gossypii TaxID=2812003 RepID=A0ABT2J302_9PSEU|nr:MaoC family dehydratase N-terminal domain-containing protein [Actinophytocola gossypii]MCT2582238.1 MaoC family dehydratase N-terminal domain-containing protein [Actinophytocola gossypii]